MRSSLDDLLFFHLVPPAPPSSSSPWLATELQDPERCVPSDPPSPPPLVRRHGQAPPRVRAAAHEPLPSPPPTTTFLSVRSGCLSSLRRWSGTDGVALRSAGVALAPFSSASVHVEPAPVRQPWGAALTGPGFGADPRLWSSSSFVVVGLAPAWRRKMTKRGHLFGFRVASHAKWVTCLPTLLELVLSPLKYYEQHILGLGPVIPTRLVSLRTVIFFRWFLFTCKWKLFTASEDRSSRRYQDLQCKNAEFEISNVHSATALYRVIDFTKEPV